MKSFTKINFTSLLACAWLAVSSLASYAAETITYFHVDIAGSPVAATDQSGNLLWKEAYRPYGERLIKQDNGSNKLWYAGKASDTQSGLSYFGARWYDPTLGRFMGVDPQGFDEENLHSFNRYAYGNNNPYKFVDPDGELPILLIPVLVWVGGGAAISGATNAAMQYFMNGTVQWGGLGGVADAAGDGAILGPAVAPFAAKGVAMETRLLTSPASKTKNALQTPVKIIVDSRGNAIPLNKGEYLTGSKDGQWVQVRDANGNFTGMRVDGPHTLKTHSDPRALQPHAHVPEVTNADKTPWLPVK